MIVASDLLFAVSVAVTGCGDNETDVAEMIALLISSALPGDGLCSASVVFEDDFAIPKPELR